VAYRRFMSCIGVLQVVEERTALKRPSAGLKTGVGVPQQALEVVNPSAPPVSVAPAFHPVATAPLAPTVESTSVKRNDFKFNDDVWSGPPQAAGFAKPPVPVPVPQPKPALSDLLSKRSRLPHEDPELFGADTRPNPVQQRNPFQTATERLQVRVTSLLVRSVSSKG
jgi:hypothetical protein